MQVAQSYKSVHATLGQTARRSRYSKQEDNRSTEGTGGFGFLKTAFEPFGTTVPFARSQAAIQKRFFSSLCHLAALYGFEPLTQDSAPYPVNIAKAMQHVGSQLIEKGTIFSLLIDGEPQRRGELLTTETFQSGYDLYYIPIKPLVLMRRDKKTKAEYEILLSILAYLHQVHGIALHTEEACYLYNQYEYIAEWEMQNMADGAYDEQEDASGILSELSQQAYGGKLMERILKHPCQLRSFKARLDRLIALPHDNLALLALAEDYYNLYQQYPTRSVFAACWAEDGSEEDIIYMEQRLAFYWSESDSLYHSLMEMVNNDLNERCLSEEPCVLQRFHKPQTSMYHDFAFVTEFYRLLELLINYLTWSA